MRLISCHIENFGNLSNTDFTFDKNFTCFCESNGYGKTTLAHFLKAMFYGFPTTKVNDKDLGERARYFPFDGGKFGGHLTFEIDGKIYKITRFFDKKSASSDEYSLTCDGEKADGDGGRLLKIDEESFLKTVFMDCNDTDSGATPEISNLMNGFFGYDDYENAIKRLKNEKKNYKLDKGNGGLIYKSKQDIKAVKEQIAELKGVQKHLEILNIKRSEKQVEVDELAAKYKQANEQKTTAGQWAAYDNYIAQAKAERELADGIKAKYLYGLPERKEVETFFAAVFGRSLWSYSSALFI